MKKQIISIALVISLLLSLAITVSSAYYGDVNGDGKVTATDARDILRHSTKVALLPDSMIKIADVNSDGKITAVDARITLRISAKLENLIEYSDNQQQSPFQSSVLQPVTLYFSSSHKGKFDSSSLNYRFYTSDNYNVLETKHLYLNDIGGKTVKLYFDENGEIQKGTTDYFDSTGEIYSSESITVNYDGQSNISFISSGERRCDYKHNLAGKITEVKSSIRSKSPMIQKFVYDSQNRLTNYYNEFDCSTEIIYNNKGFITSIQERDSSVGSAKSYIKYDNNNRVVSALTNIVTSFYSQSTEKTDYTYDSNNNLIFRAFSRDGSSNPATFEYSNKNGTKTITQKSSAFTYKYTLFNDTQVSKIEVDSVNTKYTYKFEYKILNNEQSHMYDIYNKYFKFFDESVGSSHIISFSPNTQTSIILSTLPYFYIFDDYPYIFYKEIIDIYK